MIACSHCGHRNAMQAYACWECHVPIQRPTRTAWLEQDEAGPCSTIILASAAKALGCDVAMAEALLDAVAVAAPLTERWTAAVVWRLGPEVMSCGRPLEALATIAAASMFGIKDVEELRQTIVTSSASPRMAVAVEAMRVTLQRVVMGRISVSAPAPNLVEVDAEAAYAAMKAERVAATSVVWDASMSEGDLEDFRPECVVTITIEQLNELLLDAHLSHAD